MPTIKGNLILRKNTTYNGSLTVEGNILGKNGKRHSLTVKGNLTARSINAEDITARNIDALDINAEDITAARNIYASNINSRNITARNIYAEDINAFNINANNVDALFILCEALNQKESLIARNIIENRSMYKQREIER